MNVRDPRLFSECARAIQRGFLAERKHWNRADMTYWCIRGQGTGALDLAVLRRVERQKWGFSMYDWHHAVRSLVYHLIGLEDGLRRKIEATCPSKLIDYIIGERMTE